MQAAINPEGGNTWRSPLYRPSKKHHLSSMRREKRSAIDCLLNEGTISLAFQNCIRSEAYGLAEGMSDHPQVDALPIDALPRVYPLCAPSVQHVDVKLPFGLTALQDILRGTRIGEYTGIFTTNPKGHFIMDYGPEEGFLPKIYINAEKQGNMMRFVNHSCDPNTEVRVEYDNDLRVRNIITAIKDIPRGAFLTFRYFEVNFQCLCGAEDCIENNKIKD
jgi:hypothetical protein